MVLQTRNALSEARCRLLTDVFDRHASVGMRQAGALTYLDWSDLKATPPVRRILRRLVYAALKEIRRSIRNDANLQPDAVIIGRLGAGGSVRKHADNCRKNKNGEWVRNHTPWREVTALYYLNSDFEGGEIVFEQHGLEIKPCRGLLVAFPADQHHLHEVLPVRAGARYCVQLFFTTRSERALADLARARWRSLAARAIAGVSRLRHAWQTR